jgi:hypothetical protein
VITHVTYAEGRILELSVPATYDPTPVEHLVDDLSRAGVRCRSRWANDGLQKTSMFDSSILICSTHLERPPPDVETLRIQGLGVDPLQLEVEA